MEKKKSLLYLDADKIEDFTIHPPKYTQLRFNVEEIIIRCGKLQLKLPKFWDLKDVDEITFQFEKEKHVYVRKGEVE